MRHIDWSPPDLHVPWGQALREGAVAGTAAGLLPTLVLAALGRRHGGPTGPINAVSHWLWGDESLRQDRATLRHTAIGLVTQQLAAILWATLYSAVYGHREEAKELPNAIAGGIATSATAYVVDYTITPEPLTPGYERRVDGKEMFAVYAVLAAGFTLGALALRGAGRR